MSAISGISGNAGRSVIDALLARTRARAGQNSESNSATPASKTASGPATETPQGSRVTLSAKATQSTSADAEPPPDSVNPDNGSNATSASTSKASSAKDVSAFLQQMVKQYAKIAESSQASSSLSATA